MRLGQRFRYFFFISILTFLILLIISNQVKINVYKINGSYTSSEDQEWYRIIGSPYFDEVNALIQTSDMGFVMVGSTASYGKPGFDVWIVKTNSNGNIEWNRTYDKGTNEEAHGIIQTTDGGYIVAGWTKSFSSSTDETHDIWVIKVNSTGFVEWERLYDNSGHEVAFDLIQTHDNGFALAGWTDSFSKDNAGEMLLIQTDENGMILWNQTYSCEKDPERNIAYTLIQTTDRGFALLELLDTTKKISCS
ncbi:MAG: hypothetical protein ACFE9L_01640 [Candidatus Hodarchaeota archaeon]